MKELKKLSTVAQEIAVRKWPPVSPALPATDFTIGHLPDGSPIVWPSRHLDGTDVWLCITCGTHAVDLADIDSGVKIDAEWDISEVEKAVQFASRVAADLEESRQAMLRPDRYNAEELEKQAGLLFISGLVKPDWRPGFNLLAPAVWALSKLHRPGYSTDASWKGTDVRRAVTTAVGMSRTPFYSVTVYYDYSRAPSTALFELTRGLYVRFLGPWDDRFVTVSLVLGEPGDDVPVYNFSQSVLYNVVAETCMSPYQVLELADAATTLFQLLSGEGGTEWSQRAFWKNS